MYLPTKTYKCMQQESSQSFRTIQRDDVVCARGRTYFDHKGNQQFRKLITFSKDAYSKQTSRSGKSQIVSNIIDTVFGNSGRFIKQSGTRKRWIECDEKFIREKVTQNLRDGLSFKYSSSTQRKRERSVKVQELFYGDIDKIVYSNIAVSQKIHNFQKLVENSYNTFGRNIIPNEQIQQIFNSANLDILETIKREPSMLNEMHRLKNNTHYNDTSSSLSRSSSRSSFTSSCTSSFTSSCTSSATLLSTAPSLFMA